MIQRIKETPKLRALLYFAIFFSLATARWIDTTFGSPTFEQIFFHIVSWLHKPTTFNGKIVLEFILVYLTLCLCLGVISAHIEKKIVTQIQLKTSPCRTFLAALIRNMPVFMLLLILLGSFLIFDGTGYIYKKRYITFARDHYVVPVVSSLDRKNQKNLIHIYVEGLDTGLSDANFFGEDLLSNLNAIQGTRFPRFRQVAGTGWTIAGIVASQCAIPQMALNDTTSHPNNYLCLGDLLKNAGYHNVFMGGADSDFTEKGSFFLAHGYQHIYGLDEWKQLGKFKDDDFSTLGLSDSKLFEEAKAMVKKLNQSSEPFNLTILTLDTHGAGLPDKECSIKFDKNYPVANRAKCVDQLIASFVSWALNNTPKGSTRIVIHGDHTGVFLYPPLSRYERGIFNLFVSGEDSEPKVPCEDEILHFDFAPTILSFLGFDIQDGIYGLGVNQLCDGTARNPASQAKRDNLIKKRNVFFETSKTFLGQIH